MEMSIGEQLKEARDALGVTEREAAEKTHLKREFICAMETDRFDDIKLAPVYRIGFLRIYAKYLNLDPDAIVTAYKTQAKINDLWAWNSAQENPSSDGESTEDESSFGTPLSGIEGEEDQNRGKRIVRTVAILVLAILIIVALVRVFSSDSSNDAAPEKSVAAENADSSIPSYEFEVTTNMSQRITINENYTGWNAETGTPICGAKIVDEYIMAGTPKKFVGKGTLFIKEDVLGGATIKIPDKATFDATPAGKTVELPSAAESVNQRRGGQSNSWLVEPVK